MYLKTIDNFSYLILEIIISIFIVLRNNMQWNYSLSYMRNTMFTLQNTFTTNPKSGRLLPMGKKVILVMSLNWN